MAAPAAADCRLAVALLLIFVLAATTASLARVRFSTALPHGVVAAADEKRLLELGRLEDSNGDRTSRLTRLSQGPRVVARTPKMSYLLLNETAVDWFPREPYSSAVFPAASLLGDLSSRLTSLRASTAPMIVHLAHHKTGTAWFSRVFRIYELRTNRKFAKNGPDTCNNRIDICQIANAAPASLLQLRKHRLPYRAIMTVRDPRDVVVSGYFYHLTTNESWVHVPRPDFNGRSFQEMLRSVSKHEGINLEIDLLNGGVWDDGKHGAYASALRNFMLLRDSRLAFVRYEDMWETENERLGSAFAAIGSWYGISKAADLKIFVQAAIKVGLEAAPYRSAAKAVLLPEDTGKNHFRKGDPGDWKNHMAWSNRAYFKNKLGTFLEDLGYESSSSW
eukprot:SM000105S13862  [mRNA]  locus=s105:152531:154704:+ [translate_table: standard]